MTWIADSGNMWFPHQVRLVVDPLDKKIEQLQSELVDSRDAVTAAMLIGNEAMKNYRKYRKEFEDAPHAESCKSYKGLGPCDCWKSKVIK